MAGPTQGRGRAWDGRIYVRKRRMGLGRQNPHEEEEIHHPCDGD